MINPSLRQIRAFVNVARKGNFGRAAESLHLSQSALSQTIAQLERLLDGQLFDRTTRSLELTELGRHLLPRAEIILREVDKTFEDIVDLTGLKRGSVTVGCLASITFQCLPAAIDSFAALHPNVKIAVKDGNAAGLLRLLLQGEIDFAVTAQMEEHADVAFAALLKDPFCLLCRSDHSLARSRAVAWKDLARHRYIGFDKETSNRTVIDRALRDVGLSIEPQVELAQLGTVIGLVEVGFGVAAVPAMACPTGKSLTVVPLIEPVVERQVGIATLKGRSLTHAARAFAQIVRQTLLGIGVERTGGINPPVR